MTEKKENVLNETQVAPLVYQIVLSDEWESKQAEQTVFHFRTRTVRELRQLNEVIRTIRTQAESTEDDLDIEEIISRYIPFIESHLIEVTRGNKKIRGDIIDMINITQLAELVAEIEQVEALPNSIKKNYKSLLPLILANYAQEDAGTAPEESQVKSVASAVSTATDLDVKNVVTTDTGISQNAQTSTLT